MQSSGKSVTLKLTMKKKSQTYSKHVTAVIPIRMVRSQGNLLCICRWAPAESGKVRAFWDGIQPDAGKKSLAGVTGESVEAAQMCTGYGVKDPEATAMGESALYWRPFHHKPHRKAWESTAKVSFKVRDQRRGLLTHESTQRPSPLPPLQNKNLNLCVVGEEERRAQTQHP